MNIKCHGENALYTQALLINSNLISTTKLKAGPHSKLYKLNKYHTCGHER